MIKVSVLAECFSCRKQHYFAVTIPNFDNYKFRNIALYNRVLCPYCQQWFLALTPKSDTAISISLYLDQRYFTEEALLGEPQVAHIIQVLRDALDSQRVRQFLNVESGVIRLFGDKGNHAKIQLKEIATPEIGTFADSELLKVPSDKELNLGGGQ